MTKIASSRLMFGAVFVVSLMFGLSTLPSRTQAETAQVPQASTSIQAHAAHAMIGAAFHSGF